MLLLLLLAASSSVRAAGGSIVGRVTARGEGEPIAGATVVIRGTVRGTTTNTNGEFRVTNVPPGTYVVVFSMVGYLRVVRQGVVVEEGRDAVANAELVQTAVQTEQVVVTANKREQSLQEVPVSISVMDAAEIQLRNAQTIEDALRYVPGVNITGGQVNIRGSSGYSRGAGSRVLMLLDGVPFIAGDTGELNFESIPVGQVERIEVVKGASSALYGSNALGGVINIITKSIPDVPQTIVRTYVGFYNKPTYKQWQWSSKNRFFNNQSVSHARKDGNLGIALYASRQLDDGYRENDYRRRYNFYLKTREDFSNANSLTLNFSLLYQYGGQFLYWRSLDSALIPPPQQQTDNIRSIRYYTSGLYNGVIANNWLFTAKAIWYHNDWGYETIRAIGRTESLSDALNLQAQSTLLLTDEHTITFGMDGRLDLVSADLFGNHTGGGLALYAQDEWKLLPELTFTAGGRFDFQSLGLGGPAGQLNPKAALAYTPLEGTTLRASFGRGFRIPSVAEAFLTGEVSNLAAVPNKDLRPERSYSYEAGLSQALGTMGTVDVAAFRSDFYNLIEAGLIATSSNLPLIQWRNVTRARVQGVEGSLRLGLFDGGLMWNVGYTYVQPRDLTDNDVLKYRPRHMAYTELLTRIGPVTAGGDFRYISRVGRIDVELVNLGIIPDGDERRDIIVTDFRISGDLSFTGAPLTATVNVNNALQRNYVELIGNMMPPRTYILQLEAKF